MGEKAAKPFQFRQSPTARPRFRAGSAISFFHPVAFWLGTGAVIAGVIGHIPMFVSSAEMNFRMVGMQMGLLMTLGMYAIIVGTVLVGYGLLPPDFTLRRRTRVKSADVVVRALDNAKLTPMYWQLTIGNIRRVAPPRTQSWRGYRRLSLASQLGYSLRCPRYSIWRQLGPPPVQVAAQLRTLDCHPVGGLRVGVQQIPRPHVQDGRIVVVATREATQAHRVRTGDQVRRCPLDPPDQRPRSLSSA